MSLSPFAVSPHLKYLLINDEDLISRQNGLKIKFGNKIRFFLHKFSRVLLQETFLGK